MIHSTLVGVGVGAGGSSYLRATAAPDQTGTWQTAPDCDTVNTDCHLTDYYNERGDSGQTRRHRGSLPIL